jgi:hypothetical protein
MHAGNRAPAWSYSSHSIEAFPDLRRRWITRDVPSTLLINVDFVAMRDFYFD